ncbi:WhiB family transcriptional regulator [Streptomyces olivoreticuli]|uniref:WhiB family transcriptional regulator n=1 Tax=Streptomyces olivoreticuli TaxID=68246 RepID=UPI000E260CD8|nr:WhiB family transcriptional regulator [Streptomyces olivoreticuli]
MGLHTLASWYQRAACSDVDPELFFIAGRREGEQTEIALKICGSCPVTNECLEHAQKAPEPYGIWGGTTARERGWDSLGKRRFKISSNSTPC